MDIRLFLKQKNNIRGSENDRNEIQFRRKYTAYLGNYVKNGAIDMAEYSYMIEFLKKKGPITSTYKTHNIINKIFKSDIHIDGFFKTYKNVFPHIGKLYDNKQINLKKIKNHMVKINKNIFDFTKDQKKGIDMVIDFLYSYKKIYNY